MALNGSLQIVMTSWVDREPLTSGVQAPLCCVTYQLPGHLHVGASNDHVGILFDGVYLGSDGFKDIDAGVLNTGFQRTEGVIRGFGCGEFA